MMVEDIYILVLKFIEEYKHTNVQTKIQKHIHVKVVVVGLDQPL